MCSPIYLLTDRQLSIEKRSEGTDLVFWEDYWRNFWKGKEKTVAKRRMTCTYKSAKQRFWISYDPY
jgi:hypothetical protein